MHHLSNSTYTTEDPEVGFIFPYHEIIRQIKVDCALVFFLQASCSPVCLLHGKYSFLDEASGLSISRAGQVVINSGVPAQLGLRWLWLSKTPGQAKAVNQGLASAWPGLGHGFCMQMVDFLLSTGQLTIIWEATKLLKPIHCLLILILNQ